MGTHPIFESDFDCLTEMPQSTGGSGRGTLITAPVDFITGWFWGIINFVVIFFSTMLNVQPPVNTGGRRAGGSRTGGRFDDDDRRGGGGGPKRLGTMKDFNKKAGPKMPGMAGGG